MWPPDSIPQRRSDRKGRQHQHRRFPDWPFAPVYWKCNKAIVASWLLLLHLGDTGTTQLHSESSERFGMDVRLQAT